MYETAAAFALCCIGRQIASGAGRDAHAINTRQQKMHRPDEKQLATSASLETQLPASSSVVTAGQKSPNVRSEHSDSSVAAERAAPLHCLRNEIRVWTRDLLIAIGLALVIIVFLYQPVKVEGTSMAPLLSDQERIFINKFVYRFEPIQRGDVVVFWY